MPPPKKRFFTVCSCLPPTRVSARWRIGSRLDSIRRDGGAGATARVERLRGGEAGATRDTSRELRSEIALHRTRLHRACGRLKSSRYSAEYESGMLHGHEHAAGYMAFRTHLAFTFVEHDRSNYDTMSLRGPPSLSKLSSMLRVSASNAYRSASSSALLHGTLLSCYPSACCRVPSTRGVSVSHCPAPPLPTLIGDSRYNLDSKVIISEPQGFPKTVDRIPITAPSLALMSMYILHGKRRPINSKSIFYDCSAPSFSTL
jgi:hypothetical protein